MLAKELLDNVVSLGWVLVALVFLLGLLALINRGKIQKLSLGAGKMRADIDMTALHDDIRSLKTAVEVITTEVKNGKPTTLVERVDRIDTSLAWQGDVLGLLAHHVGMRLPERPHDSYTV